MLQEIVNVANLGFVVIGPKLEIRLWNKWMAQATGIGSETACYQRADKLLPTLFTPELIAKVRGAIDEGVATSILQSDGEFSISSMPVDVLVQPLAARHYVHSLRPVREETVDQLCLLQIRPLKGAHVAAEAVVGKVPAEEKPEQADRLNFLAMIGHQIRTPVNGVLGVAELLRDTSLSAEQRKYVDMLVRAGHSLQAFVNELTDLSYLEAGRVILQPEVTDLPHLIQDVMGLFESMGSQKNVQGVLELAPNLPKHVMVDHQKLQQLIVILLSNAFKYTHKGSVTLKAGYVAGEEAGTLVVEVLDTGVGIPQSRIGSLFEPGKPVADNAGRFYNKTGLGLYLCREIVDLFGGTVEVESAVEKGSKFSLHLPVKVAETMRPTQQGKKTVGRVRDHGEWRVLLAEDNPVNQELFKQFLERSGHEVVIVSNGQEAVSAVQIQEPFDVILMDIAMPVMDGLEATALIRSLYGAPGQTPILALTAHALEGDREVFIDAGMDGYQSKPVDPEALQEAMARAITSRKNLKRWSDPKVPKQSAHPASGPKSWLRFPGLGRPRETDRADQ